MVSQCRRRDDGRADQHSELLYDWLSQARGKRQWCSDTARWLCCIVDGRVAVERVSGGADVSAAIFSADQSHAVNHYHVQIALIVVMSVASAGLLFLTCVRRLRERISVRHIPADDGAMTSSSAAMRRVRAHVWIPLVALFVLLVGIVLMNLLQIVAHVDCFDVLSSSVGYTSQHAAVGVLYHASMCTFCLAMFLFVCVFCLAYMRMRRTSALRYFLCLLLTAMLFLYFDLELTVLQPVNNMCPSHNLTRCEQCIRRETKHFQTALKMERLLLPFYLEFFVLATDRLLPVFGTNVSDGGHHVTGKSMTCFLCRLVSADSPDESFPHSCCWL